MAYKIIWKDEAQEDIRDILHYLLNEWNDTIAEKFSDFLIKAATQLETQPNSGRKHKTLSAIRELPLKPYYILCYTVYKKEQEVHILNVLDTRRSN